MYKNGKYVGYIYKITNKINGKIYIGQTIYTISKRWNDHISSANTNSSKSMIIYNAMRKYGIDNFLIDEVECIDAVTSDKLFEKLNEREIHYISIYNSLKPNGYNCTEGGYNNSPDCKRIVNQYSLSGEYINTFPSIVSATQHVCPGGNNGNIQSVCSGETKTAYGYVWRYDGDPFDLYDFHHDGDRPIIQYDFNGNIINEYKTMSDAARSLGLFAKNGKPRSGQICQCCKGTRRQAYGYIWRYKGDSFDLYSIKKYHFSRKVVMYTKDNEYIKTFNTVKDAAEYLDTSDGSIINCCKHRANTHFCKGFRLLYADDPDQPDKSKIIAA